MSRRLSRHFLGFLLLGVAVGCAQSSVPQEIAEYKGKSKPFRVTGERAEFSAEYTVELPDIWTEHKSSGFDSPTGTMLHVILRIGKLSAVDEDYEKYLLDTSKKASGYINKVAIRSGKYVGVTVEEEGDPETHQYYVRNGPTCLWIMFMKSKSKKEREDAVASICKSLKPIAQ